VSEFAARYGPWAVVAGASEGLGAAFARELAGRGLNLVLLARRKDALDELAASLDVDVRAVAMDLARPDLAVAVGGVLADLDVGLLVYNAAYAPIGAFADVPLADKLRAVDVNCRGPVTLADAVAPRLRRRGRGGIVLMSSLTAFFGSPRLATYGATKAFNLALGEALWAELRPDGVDVLVCCAGATRTPGFERQTGGDGPRAMTAEAVVAEALAALGRRPVLVPGRFNRFAAWLLGRVLPRRAAVAIMGGQTKRLRP
jgi:short-subunit dehydrogenase